MECEQLRYEDALMTMHRHPGLPSGPPPFGSHLVLSIHYFSYVLPQVDELISSLFFSCTTLERSVALTANNLC